MVNAFLEVFRFATVPARCVWAWTILPVAESEASVSRCARVPFQQPQKPSHPPHIYRAEPDRQKTPVHKRGHCRSNKTKLLPSSVSRAKVTAEHVPIAIAVLRKWNLFSSKRPFSDRVKCERGDLVFACALQNHWIEYFPSQILKHNCCKRLQSHKKRINKLNTTNHTPFSNQFLRDTSVTSVVNLSAWEILFSFLKIPNISVIIL